MLTPFNKLAQPGIVPDTPDLNLVEGAWTDSRNVRYRDGAVEKVRGYTQALGESFGYRYLGLADLRWHQLLLDVWQQQHPVRDRRRDTRDRLASLRFPMSLPMI
jgi:hypothetical protein